MAEWSLAQLEQVADVVGRGISPIYIEDDGVLVLNQKCVRDGRVLVEPARRHDALTRSIPSKKLLSGGEILINSTGVGTLGRTAFVGKIDVPMTADSHVTIVRTKSGFHPRWLGYAIRNLEPDIEALAIGSTGQTELGRSLVCGLPINVPPLAEQQAIAGVLGALDDKIESNQRQQSTLLGICHAAFDVALMKGPDVMKVEDMVRFRNNERKPLSAMERSGMKRRYPYYGATGIFDYVDGYLFDDVNILIGEDGSVVNDDGTPVAQMAWGKYWVNNHAHVLSGKAVSTELAFIALARSDVRPLITGAVQLKINMGNLKSLEVALPSVEVRGDVNREIQENFALWRAKSDESKMLVGLRDALLPELLSGRLRVKDAESMMENV